MVTGTTSRLVLEHEGVRRVVPIDTLPFTIGRGADSNLVIADPGVSRTHAHIEHSDAGYVICDQHSRHGTFVNSVRIESAPLRDGDLIHIGRGRDALRFEDKAGSATRTLLGRLSRSGLETPAQTDLEKLSLFLEAAQSLSGFDASKDVMRSMIEYSIQLTGAERGFVFLGETAETLRLECGFDRRGGELGKEPAISYSIVRDAAASRLDFILSDVTDEMASERASLAANEIRSVIAIPLRGQDSAALRGLLYLDSHVRNKDLSKTGKEILHVLARQAATLLENLRLMEMERQSALLKKELEIAAAIQSQIIPQKLPEFSYARFSARTIPCTGVGGDFYDVIPVVDGFFAIIADVCGKGVPAALLASMVQGMFHAQTSLGAARGVSLLESVEWLNASVCSRTPQEKYVTLAALRYSCSDANAVFVELINGGHVSPMIVRADGRMEVIRDGDLPIGLMESAKYHVICLSLSVGDRVLLLTDGITEAENAEGSQFGMERLRSAIGAADPVSSIFDAVREFCAGSPAQDDQTILEIQRLA